MCTEYGNRFFSSFSQKHKQWRKRWKKNEIFLFRMSGELENWSGRRLLLCCCYSDFCVLCERIRYHKSWNRIWNWKCLCLVRNGFAFNFTFTVRCVLWTDAKWRKTFHPLTHELTKEMLDSILWFSSYYSFSQLCMHFKFLNLTLSSVVMHNDVWFIHPYTLCILLKFPSFWSMLFFLSLSL